MAGSPLLSRLVRALPGAAAHPEDVGRRRLLVGSCVIIAVAALQTVPPAFRGQVALPLFFRYCTCLVELIVLTVVLSVTYKIAQRRRWGSVKILVSNMCIGGVLGSIWLVSTHKGIQLFPALRLPDEPKLLLTKSIGVGAALGMLHVGMWALAFVFPYVADDARLRALQTDKLHLEADKLKSAAELARLRSQLEPHFLLNTLNTIAGLVTEDPREARRLLAALGDLLRDSLRDGDEMTTLDEEIAWLRRYAQILESRHSGVLAFKWEIESGAARTLVPRLLLQPLVENAVKHGALRRRAGGVVTVRANVAERDGKRRVVCVVEDNGPGMGDKAPRQGAFGLHSVRRRLELRFPDATLTMESSKDGTRSIVDLPSQVRTAISPARSPSSTPDTPDTDREVA